MSALRPASPMAFDVARTEGDAIASLAEAQTCHNFMKSIKEATEQQINTRHNSVTLFIIRINAWVFVTRLWFPKKERHKTGA
jgi:hypothetical protein